MKCLWEEKKGGKEKQRRQRSDEKLYGFMSMYGKFHYNIVKYLASN